MDLRVDGPPGKSVYFVNLRDDSEYDDGKVPVPQLYSDHQQIWIQRRQNAEESRRTENDFIADAEQEEIDMVSREEKLPESLQPPEWSGAPIKEAERSGEGAATAAAGEPQVDLPAASGATSASEPQGDSLAGGGGAQARTHIISGSVH